MSWNLEVNNMQPKNTMLEEENSTKKALLKEFPPHSLCCGSDFCMSDCGNETT